MTKALTRLAVDNREILERLDEHGSPASLDEFARILGRDRSNLRKSLKALAEEGWLTVDTNARPPLALTEGGRQLLAGMAVAAGRLRAGLPTLTHAQISPDPNQPRQDFDPAELDDLAESIADRGQLQPLLVRMTAADAAMIVDGERRWRSIGLLIERADPRWPAERPIEYHLSSRADEAEILVDQVVANLQRANLHELEEALAFSDLKAKGWGVGQIAKTIGKTRKFVETRLDLLLLPKAQQDRMRLPKDDPNRLSFTRAREMVQHLRQVASAQDEQRDVEEIAPTPAVAEAAAELQEEARKLKIDAKGLMMLGEIETAARLAPSTKFPHSPGPIVDLAGGTTALYRDRTFEQISAVRHTLAELLIDGDAEGRPAGLRLTQLGHTKLRQEQKHPADSDRNLYHLRRDAGISADQARQLTRAGRYATAWLNAAEEPSTDQGGAAERVPTPWDRAEKFSPEVREAALAEYQKTAGNDRALNALVSGTTTIEGEAWPAQPTEILATEWDGYPRAVIRLTESSWGRWGVSLVTHAGGPGYGGQSSPPTVWSRDPIFRSRADALAVAAASIVERLGETWGRKRNLQAWLQQIQAPPAAEPQTEIQTPEISEPQLRILRELAHAQQLNHGNPVPVGRHWMDLDAVALSKRTEPLIEFKAAPGEGWRGAVTSAGRQAIEILAPGLEFSLELRIGRNGGYDTAWLNPDPAPIGEQLGETADNREEDRDAGDSQVLTDVRAQLAAGDGRAALQLLGLAGKFQVDGDASITFSPAGGGPIVDLATIDPSRTLEEDVAQARAELIAFALNQLLEPQAATAPALLEIRAGDVVTKGGAMTWRILEAMAKPGHPAHAFKAQPILHGKDYGKPTTVSIGDITGLLPRPPASAREAG